MNIEKKIGKNSNIIKKKYIYIYNKKYIKKKYI